MTMPEAANMPSRGETVVNHQTGDQHEFAIAIGAVIQHRAKGRAQVAGAAVAPSSMSARFITTIIRRPSQ